MMKTNRFKLLLLTVLVIALSVPGFTYAASVTAANGHRGGSGDPVINRKLRFNDDGSYTWINTFVSSYMAGTVLEETFFQDGSKKQELIYSDGSRAACRVNEDKSITENFTRVKYENGEKRIVRGEKTTYPDGTVKSVSQWDSVHPGGQLLSNQMEVKQNPDGTTQTIVRIRDKEGNPCWILSEDRDPSGFATVTSDGGGMGLTFQGTYPELKLVGGDVDEKDLTVKEITIGERTYRVVSGS